MHIYIYIYIHYLFKQGRLGLEVARFAALPGGLEASPPGRPGFLQTTYRMTIVRNNSELILNFCNTNVFTGGLEAPLPGRPGFRLTANLRTKMLDFRGFDSSRILCLRGGILMSRGNFPESLSQAILVGRILVGRLGVDLALGLTTSALGRHRLSGYLAQRVPSIFLASSFRMSLDCEVLNGMFPWRTMYLLARYPLSRCR